jgi:hypothetical protein
LWIALNFIQLEEINKRMEFSPEFAAEKRLIGSLMQNVDASGAVAAALDADGDISVSASQGYGSYLFVSPLARRPVRFAACATACTERGDAYHFLSSISDMLRGGLQRDGL